MVLQTGYASDKPARDMMRQLDIQGYCDKAEGPEKLLLWTEVGLKSAHTVQMLEKNRRGLRYILDVTPELHKLQPLDDLLQGILWQVAGLLGAIDSFVAAVAGEGHPTQLRGAEGLLALLEDGALLVHAATGRFTGNDIENDLSGDRLQAIRDLLRAGELSAADGTCILPLRVGTQTIGVMYLDRAPIHERDTELLGLFANQAAVAIHNVRLHEMATLDGVTGLAVRRYFDRRFAMEIRDSLRNRQPISLLLLDVDHMKRINDEGGHLAGDQVLSRLGEILRQSLRANDVAGRFGGDELAVVLPVTTAARAEEVACRIATALSEETARGNGVELPVRCSIGVASFEPPEIDWDNLPRPVPNALFQEAATCILEAADRSLYAAKSRQGDGPVAPTIHVTWQPFASSRTGATPAHENGFELPAGVVPELHLAAAGGADGR